jgi:dihydroorotate dehydrogenase
MRMIGCGFMTGGSVTRRPRAGNPRPWFYRLPKSRSLVVHAGLANQGIDKITTNVQRHDNVRTDMPLMISVAVVVCDDACTTDNAIAEACETLQIIQHKRLAQMVEINISCPNAQDGQPFTQLDNLQKLLESIDARELRLPIFIKMPNKPSWGEY